MKKINFKNLNNGFTLIETLVAVSIFAVSVTVLVVVSGGGLADLSVAKNRLVANYLAQEGIELVRYQRDQSIANTFGWPYFADKLTRYCTANQPCNLDPLGTSSGSVIQCGTTPGGCLSQTVPGTGYYTFPSGYASVGAEDTIFERRIIVNPITHGGGSVEEVEVISTVTWQQGIGNYEVSLRTNLFNW
jgi:prepilin-type N-terminal cleavage/methylation domain-containing protein